MTGYNTSATPGSHRTGDILIFNSFISSVCVHESPQHSAARSSAIQWLAGAGAGLCTGWAPALNCSRPMVTSLWHTVLCPLCPLGCPVCAQYCPVCPQCCPVCRVCPQSLVAGVGQTEDAEEQVPHGPGQPGHPELDTATAATALTHRYLLPPITLFHQSEEQHACSTTVFFGLTI